MKCPFCNYDFYTLRNHIVTEFHHESCDNFDLGRIARKLLLNCPQCNNNFVSWAHFEYDPKNSEAFSPSDNIPDHATFK